MGGWTGTRANGRVNRQAGERAGGQAGDGRADFIYFDLVGYTLKELTKADAHLRHIWEDMRHACDAQAGF